MWYLVPVMATMVARCLLALFESAHMPTSMVQVVGMSVSS